MPSARCLRAPCEATYLTLQHQGLFDFAASWRWHDMEEIGLHAVPAVRYSRRESSPALGEVRLTAHLLIGLQNERRRRKVQLQRPKAFAGFLIVGLIALAGFAAFSATGVRSAPPVDIPAEVSARVAGNILGVDLGPDTADRSLAPDPDSSVIGSEQSGAGADSDGGDP